MPKFTTEWLQRQENVLSLFLMADIIGVMTKAYKIILNPTAGNGNGKNALPQIEQLFTQNKVSFNLVLTERPGHGIELTRQAVKEGYEVIVAVGGDGTVNEVVNGLMESKLEGAAIPPMGVLCVGRGNDFAGSVGIPEDIEGGFRALMAGNRRIVDVGRVVGGKYPQGRYFANCVGVGFDAITTIEVHKLPRWGGYLAFMAAVLKTVFLYNKAPLARIEYDGNEITQRSLLISIMNGRRLGGGFIMAPNSLPDDGLFDLCIAEQMSSFEVIKMIPHFTRGDQATQPSIKTGQAAKISITAQDGPLPAQTDGEIICVDGSHLEVEVLPRQIEIIYKPQQA
jgi:YegS/Rv2252/BmrU family lipid kinase